MPYIRSFKINNLFGYRNIEINQNADCIIIVGENGSGKSTVMNCLYYVLTKRFEDLLKIDFESIEIIFNSGKKFELRHKDIVPVQPIRLNMTERRFVTQLNEVIQIGDIRFMAKVFESGMQYEEQVVEVANFLKTKKIPTARFSPISQYNCVKSIFIDSKQFLFESTISELSKYLLPENQIFHLTTYRRVETPKAADEKEDPNTEIVYGMKDVKKMLKDIQDEINEKNRIGFNNMMISLLDNLVLKKEHQEQIRLDVGKVGIVLSRLGTQLSDVLRNSIIEYCQKQEDSNSELDFLIEELIKLYELQEELDKSIVQFCTRCNKYLKGKQFEYDVANVRVTVRSTHNGVPIDLEALSSGEKQMIGLMAKMYLSRERDFVVLIDEPELSLSIKWQETILEDMYQSGKIKYMMAVTHSPFIYDNSMSKYAVGMSNFVKDLK